MAKHKIDDWVTNRRFGSSEPFKLKCSDFKGISAKSKEWFSSLKTWKPKEGDWIFVIDSDDSATLCRYNQLKKGYLIEPFIGTLPNFI